MWNAVFKGAAETEDGSLAVSVRCSASKWSPERSPAPAVARAWARGEAGVFSTAEKWRWVASGAGVSVAAGRTLDPIAMGGVTWNALLTSFPLLTRPMFAQHSIPGAVKTRPVTKAIETLDLKIENFGISRV